MNGFSGRLVVYGMLFLTALNSTRATAQNKSSDEGWTPLQISLFPPMQFPNANYTVYGLSLGILQTAYSGDDIMTAEIGRNDIYGLQISGVMAKSKESHGVQLAGLSSCAKGHSGIQLSGGANIVKGTLNGVQLSGLWNEADEIPCGVQATVFANVEKGRMGFGLQLAGVINRCESAGAGLQLAVLFNEASKDFRGAQVGLFNKGKLGATTWFEHHRIGFTSYGQWVAANYYGVENMRGLQLGLFNKAENMKGLQIGVVNMADTMTGLQIGLVNIIKESSVPFLPIINAHF